MKEEAIFYLKEGIMNSNVYDISHKHDPERTYSKVFEESKCDDFEDYINRIEAQTLKLQRGVFACKGNFYFAKFNIIDLTKKEHDPISNTTTTICRKTKFKWNYILLK